MKNGIGQIAGFRLSLGLSVSYVSFLILLIPISALVIPAAFTTRYTAIYWVQVLIIIGYEVLRVRNHNRLLKDKQEIELLSVTDHLTGLYNRRYFSRVIEGEYARAIRQKKSLGFLMIDADHFKKFNDNFGHLKGDDLLVAIANVLKKVVMRSSDLVFRMGGEEFGVLLPDTDAKGAHAVAEKIRAKINETTVITVSVGYVSIVPQVGGDFESLFKLADNNLYKAKTQGRNKVIGTLSSTYEYTQIA